MSLVSEPGRERQIGDGFQIFPNNGNYTGPAADSVSFTTTNSGG